VRAPVRMMRTAATGFLGPPAPPSDEGEEDGEENNDRAHNEKRHTGGRSRALGWLDGGWDDGRCYNDLLVFLAFTVIIELVFGVLAVGWLEALTVEPGYDDGDVVGATALVG